VQNGPICGILTKSGDLQSFPTSFIAYPFLFFLIARSFGRPLMRIQPTTFVDISTEYGPMRTHLFRPLPSRNADQATRYPAVLLYSEIYQMTGPITRTAAMLAGQGFLVAVPDVYHEFTEPGEVFAYDKAGTDRGNELKTTKELRSYEKLTPGSDSGFGIHFEILFDCSQLTHHFFGLCQSHRSSTNEIRSTVRMAQAQLLTRAVRNAFNDF
jgi:hypothetical protein